LSTYYESVTLLLDTGAPIYRTGNLPAIRRYHAGWDYLFPPDIAKPFHEYIYLYNQEAEAAYEAALAGRVQASNDHQRQVVIYGDKASAAMVPIVEALNIYCNYGLKFEDLFTRKQ